MKFERLHGSIIAAVAAAFFCVSVQGQWKPVGDLTNVERESASSVLVETASGARVRVTAGNDSTVRFRFSPKGRFEDSPGYALLDPGKSGGELSYSQGSDKLDISLKGGVRISIRNPSFNLSVVDASGDTVLQQDPNDPAMFNPATGESKISFLRRGEVETYYGFGEKAFAGMSRHGEYIVNWNTDTYAYPVGLDPIYQSIPFFYALRDGKAYGIFLNNTYRTFFDMGKASPERYTFGADGGDLDFYVFTGGKDRSPAKVLEDYAGLTGTSEMPPLWALGNQQSRWSYYPESKVREIASTFRRLRIPADVIYLDIDYMDGYRVFTWNNERFPDPRKMISELEAEGFKVVLIVDPGVKVDPNYYVYKDGLEKGVFVKNPDGSEFNANVWPGLTAFPDFTDPKAREWFGSLYKSHVAEGIAGFWNDMNEPATFTTPKSERPLTYHHPGKTFPYDTPHNGDGYPGDHRRYHNVYGMQMARATFEGLLKLAPEKRPLVITRAGFAGIQRYSAVWTGDNIATWTHLQLTIPMLTNLSVSGVPLIGADVGGFSGEPDGELYTRWIQAAALTPFFRSHSETGVKDKEPWAFGDRFTPINRAAVELRYRLLPYMYTQFYEHQRNGTPVVRPLWFNYPKDTNTYLNSDQYLLGNDIMVAPVLVQGKTARSVYFPEGDDWRDLDTGELYKGGTTAVIKAPLEKVPVFGRVGSVIPMQPVVQNTGEMKNVPVTLVVIAGIAADKSEKGELFQDSGDGWGFKGGGYESYRIIGWEHSRGSLRLGVRGSESGYQPVSAIEAIGIAAKPAEILVNGKDVDFDYDDAAGRLRLKLEKLPADVVMRR